ncbi:hypothetical protein [Halomonas sp. N3-2A]|uniref:hypothetical protein n=1 Tax=Halomonas sp. N3-2A TaxID=2014541 RepID=UPI000B5B2603|nr:hypothetical protein [Halomonas sp. N3-2A]ASK21729.1 hypothetical protein CEK60_21600 [Halomonas sp. N3-2A]
MITDSEGNVVNATATVGADGSYTTTEDLSSLVDGEITVDASAEDRNGNPVSDSDSGELDATAGTLDVTLGDLSDDTAVEISGTTSDVADGETVTLVITDSEGNVVNATATVGADGSYTTTEDLSSLVDGEITVDASAEDRNGNPVSDSDSGELDATAGTLDVTLGDLADNTAVEISGTTSDVADGETVTLVITDSEGNVVNATATVGADGSYTTTEDLSSLVDGEITVDASAEDRNGNPVSDSDSGELDATAGTLDVTLGDLADNTAVEISGTTSDVADGETVTLVITDSEGNVVNATATVGADGSYTTTEDLSSLVDGEITVDASAEDRRHPPCALHCLTL